MLPGTKRVKWLHVLPTVDPRSGGPIEGVRNLGRHLTGIGHRVEIVSLDAPSEPFIKDFPFPVHALGPSIGRYRYCRRLVPWLRQHGREFDIVIVNGIWQYSSFGAARALRGSDTPYFVFTHGMLDPWFKQTYPLKHLKKWLYWPWGDYRVLRDAKAVLFTCEEERRLARKSFWLYRAREKVVGYGIGLPPQAKESLRERFLTQFAELRGRRILLFLSRIHPKKGCDILIRAFARIAAGQPEVSLVMAGPDSKQWMPELKRLASELGVADRIFWPGMLQGELKWGAFYASEAFILPSHQENFGIAVAEALGCGLPVLISDKVNIWREIRDDRAGLVDTDDDDGTYRNMNSWFEMPASERSAMGARASETYRRRFTVQSMADTLLELAHEPTPPTELSVKT